MTFCKFPYEFSVCFWNYHAGFQNGSLLDSSFIECLGVFCRVLQVLLIGAGEVVGTAEIFLGAHVDVLVLYVVEHGIDACHRRDADRTRRKSRILVLTGEHELQSMDNEVDAIAQSGRKYLFAAVPVSNWNDALSPWKSPAVWGKQGFGGKAGETLRFLTDQVIPSLKQQYPLPENVRIILGGYSLAGLFALWASTQTNLFYGIAAASPSVWFPGWMEFEQQHPIQAQHIYLSLGDKEERTKNTVMAAVVDNIRTLHSRLTERGADCTLEWNSGGHFKDADLRTAKAFRWVMEEHTGKPPFFMRKL